MKERNPYIDRPNWGPPTDIPSAHLAAHKRGDYLDLSDPASVVPLRDRMRQMLKEAARTRGYSHPEHLSGDEWPATEIPCLPETVAEQIIDWFFDDPQGFIAALREGEPRHYPEPGEDR